MALLNDAPAIGNLLIGFAGRAVSAKPLDLDNGVLRLKPVLIGNFAQ